MNKKEKVNFRKLFIGVLLPLIILIIVLIFALNFKKKPQLLINNNTLQLTTCLKNNNWIMYGANSCPYCQQQKGLFGQAFHNINYIDCELNTELCEKNGISKYPVWEKDGKKYYGVYTLKDLAVISGCKYQ